MSEVAHKADLSARVPSCPDWSVADLAQHVGMVYLHKVACMRLGHHPAEWPPPGAADEPSLELLDRAYVDLVAEFAARDPAERTFTWYGPDQSVGFWIRRMAQETVIHRVDTELGAGVEVAPIPDDLAVDGIDELLVAFIEYGSHQWLDELGDVLGTADGRAVRIETGDAAWLVRLTPEGVAVRRSDVDDSDAVVRGEPKQVLLWLWNRADDDVVTMTGDAELVAYLRTVLKALTQ
jgi:uncharacterized protein (TIGR03083 family)